MYIPQQLACLHERTYLMPKWPRLVSLKKKAPKVPDFTCIHIDNIIDKLEKLASDERLLTKAQLTRLRNSLERLRSSNDKLRDSGIFWYEEYKKLLDRLKQSK